MRSLTNEVLDLFDTGRIAIRQLLRFDLGSGTYGFWTGSRPTTINSVTYLPGSVIQVFDVNGSIGMNAEGLEISLSQSPEDGITPDLLATIEQEDYHQRPVTISDLYLHPDTYEVLLVEPVYRGYIDTIKHEIGSEGKITASCESRALDNTREGYRMRSTSDQGLISSGDLFYQHAEIAGKIEVFWGRDRK